MRLAAIGLAAFALFSAPALALQALTYEPIVVNETELQRSEQYVSAENAALHGFDTVAYHVVGEPTPGDPTISARYNGAVWLFSSEENRALFLNDPDRYAPAFDGHCVFAASRGAKAGGNPHYFYIDAGGVLYLNLSARAQTSFLRAPADNIAAAVTNWNEGAGGLFGGGPLFERGAADPIRGVEGEVDPV